MELQFDGAFFLIGQLLQVRKKAQEKHLIFVAFSVEFPSLVAGPDGEMWGRCSIAHLAAPMPGVVVHLFVCIVFALHDVVTHGRTALYEWGEESHLLGELPFSTVAHSSASLLFNKLIPEAFPFPPAVFLCNA